MTSKGRTSFRRKVRREFNLGDNSTHDAAFEQNMRSPKIAVNASMQLHSPVITPTRRRGHLDSSSLSEGKLCSQVTPSKWTSLLPDYGSSQAGESPTEVTWDCASPLALQYLRRPMHGDSSKLKDILQGFNNDGPKPEEKPTALQLNVLRASIQHPSGHAVHRQRKERRKQRPVSNKAVELCGKLMTALKDTQPTHIQRTEPGCDIVEPEVAELDHEVAADNKDSLPSGGHRAEDDKDSLPSGGHHAEDEDKQSCEDGSLPSGGRDGLDADDEDGWDDNDLFENSSFIIKATQMHTDILDSSTTARRGSSPLPVSLPDESPGTSSYGSNDRHNSGIVPPTLMPNDHSWEKFKALAPYTVESTAKPGRKDSSPQNSNFGLTSQAVSDNAKMSVIVSGTAAESDATNKRHFASPRILFTDDATTSAKSVESIVMKPTNKSVKNSINHGKDCRAADAKGPASCTDNKGNILPANPGHSSSSKRRQNSAVGGGLAQMKVPKDLSSYGLSDDLMAMLADPDDEFDSPVIDQFPTQPPPRLAAPSTLAAHPPTNGWLKDGYGNSRSRKPEPRQGAGSSRKCSREEYQKAMTKSVGSRGGESIASNNKDTISESKAFRSKSDTAVRANKCEELFEDLDLDILASICEYDSFSESPKCVKRPDKPVYVPVTESSKSEQRGQHNGCWVRKLSVAPVSVATVAVATVAEIKTPDRPVLLQWGRGSNEERHRASASATDVADIESAARAVPEVGQLAKGSQVAASGPHRILLEPALSKDHKVLLEPALSKDHKVLLEPALSKDHKCSDQPGSRACSRAASENQALARRKFSFKPLSQLPSSQTAKCLPKSATVGGPCAVARTAAGVVTSASAYSVAHLVTEPDSSQTLDRVGDDMGDDALYESQIIALLDEAESQATQLLASQAVGQDSLTVSPVACRSPPAICSQDQIEQKRQAAINRRHLRNKTK